MYKILLYFYIFVFLDNFLFKILFGFFEFNLIVNIMVSIIVIVEDFNGDFVIFNVFGSFLKGVKLLVNVLFVMLIWNVIIEEVIN